MSELEAERRKPKEALLKCQEQLLLGFRITFIFMVLVYVCLALLICLMFACRNCLNDQKMMKRISVPLTVGVYAPTLFKPLFLAVKISSYRDAFAEVYRRIKNNICH